MKKILLMLIGFFSLSAAAQSLKVMTFNIRYANPDDGENYWENRKHDVFGMLHYYHPDILGIQEGLQSQMDALQTGLKNYKHVGVGRDDGKTKGEYAAIFYNAEKLSPLKSGTFWLSETPGKPSKGWDAALNRICTYALFRMQDGKKFWAFNVHFDHIGNLARINSSKLILNKIKKLNIENFPVVLTGDFNLPDDSEPVKIMSAALDDTFTHAKMPHYGTKGTFQDFDVKVPAKDRIDYIFVKDFNVENHRTITDRRDNLLYFSDHFPVISEISF